MTEREGWLDKQMQEETRRLLDEFKGVIAPEAVRQEVARVLEEHRFARIRTYVPFFTYRSARSALRRLASISMTGL